jgi:prevent-host-death family protein
MKTATVRDLRNHYTRLLAWIAAGEEITIIRRGKPVARLSPAPPSNELEKVDWNQSAAVTRDRSQEINLSAGESSELRKEAGGRW